MCQIFKGSVSSTAGYDAPEPIAGLPGWTVDRMGQQTSIYRVTHNLGQTYPGADIRVFVFSEYQAPLDPENPNAPILIYNKKLEILSQGSDDFIVQTFEKNNVRREFYEHSCPFGFIVVV
jgi:hypothetical protein